MEPLLTLQLQSSMILPRYLHREELLFLSGLILEIKGDEMPAQLFVILLILWIQDEEDEVKPIKGIVRAHDSQAVVKHYKKRK